MILRVPITGELTEYDPENPEVARGNSDNPVRPLDFSKLLPDADFAWIALEYDFENGFVTIEVEFAKKTIITEWDNTKDPPEPLAWKKESDAEFYKRQADTGKALRAFEKKTAKELYEKTKELELKKPEKN